MRNIELAAELLNSRSRFPVWRGGRLRRICVRQLSGAAALVGVTDLGLQPITRLSDRNINPAAELQPWQAVSAVAIARDGACGDVMDAGELVLLDAVSQNIAAVVVRRRRCRNFSRRECHCAASYVGGIANQRQQLLISR